MKIFVENAKDMPTIFLWAMIFFLGGYLCIRRILRAVTDLPRDTINL
jgi:hypothetical protein